jgi:transcription-repair coupling factor (superfamily II helicase)
MPICFGLAQLYVSNSRTGGTDQRREYLSPTYKPRQKLTPQALATAGFGVEIDTLRGGVHAGVTGFSSLGARNLLGEEQSGQMRSRP